MFMKEKQKNDKNMYGIVHACVQAKNKELGQMHFGLCMLSKLFCITHIFQLRSGSSSWCFYTCSSTCLVCLL